MRCKHYTGGILRKEECAAGVNARQLVGGDDFGWLKRTPCHKNHNCTVSCDKREFPSKEERERSSKEWRELVETVFPLIMRIKDQNKPNSSGKCDCPKCGGTLHWKLQSNNHIHAKCETENCILFKN